MRTDEAGSLNAALTFFAVCLVHARGIAGPAAAPEQGEHSIGGIALSQAPGEVVERRLVLREDDQALVVAEFAVGPEQVLDTIDEGVEAGVHDGRLIRDGGVVQHESQGRERTFDAVDLVGHIVGEVPEPRAHDGSGGGCALLGFPVVAGLLTYGALGRTYGTLGSDEFRLVRRFGVRVHEALPCPAPGLGECGGAGEQPLAEDLHREGSGTAAGLGVRRHELANSRTEGIEGSGECDLARIGLQQKRHRRMPGAEPGAINALPRECMPFALSGFWLLALISRFSRRTTTSSIRPRMAAVISLVRVNRTGSSISSRPVNERVWPLCGVAERKSRCSNCGATRRSILQSSLSSPKGDGIRLWHSSTISRSQGRCGEPSGVRQAERNCSSTSG